MMSAKLHREVISAAISYRIFLVVLAVGANVGLPDYDTSTTLLYGAVGDSSCRMPRLLATSFDRWDAVHFAGIAIDGYVYEHNHAFYPGLPLLARGLARGVLRHIFQNSVVACDERTVLVLSFLGISHLASLLAVPIMLSLSLAVLGSPGLSKTATMLFILQPSATFTLAPYTEAPFALLTLAGMRLLEAGLARGGGTLSQEVHGMLAALCFGLATCVRSNGVTLVGFLCVYFLRRLCPSLLDAQQSKPPQVRGSESVRATAPRARAVLSGHVVRKAVGIGGSLILLACQIIVCLAGHWAFAAYGHLRFCRENRSAAYTASAHGARERMATTLAVLSPVLHAAGLVGSGGGLEEIGDRPWCLGGNGPYGFVQGRYWGVGLFQYYQVCRRVCVRECMSLCTVFLCARVRVRARMCACLKVRVRVHVSSPKAKGPSGDRRCKRMPVCCHASATISHPVR